MPTSNLNNQMRFVVVTFNPFDPRYEADGVPRDLLAEAGRSSPVSPMPQGGYVLARQEEVLSALKDIEAFRADLTHGPGIPGPPGHASPRLASSTAR